MPRRKSSNPNPQEATPDQELPQTEKPVKAAKAATPKYWTKEGYEPEPESMDMVHVATSTFTLQRGTFDKTTHQKVNILDSQMWKMCREEWPKQGIYFVEMLHYPTGTPEGFVQPE